MTWLAALCLLGGATVVLAQVPFGAVGVYYVGAQDAVAQAISNADPYLVLVDRPELADVYVLNNAPLTPGALLTIRDQVLREEVGLVLVTGPLFPTEIEDLRMLLGVGVFGLNVGARTVRPVQVGAEPHLIHEAVAWSSAPEIGARTVITNPNLLMPLVETTGGEPILQRVRGRETTQIFLLGLWPEDPGNADWATWPYFDYLVYRLVAEAADAPRVLRFADYPRVPVPHGSLRLALILGGVGLVILTLNVTFLARRAFFLQPAALPPFKTPDQATSGAWSRIGFHRPLAGLLFQLGGWVILFLPWLVYGTRVLPRVLIPWAQTLSFWEEVTLWSTVIWIALDLGLGMTAVRFFALHSLHSAAEGFRYFQFYIWWQLLSGAVQLAVTAFLAVLVFPYTPLAHVTFYFLVRMLLQFPGFLQVFRYLFLALRRFDYAQFLSILATALALPLQAGGVWFFRRWGARWPDVGPQVGSILGLGLGLYLAEGLVFVAGLILYKRCGYSLRRLFRPAFDGAVARRAMGFGLRFTFGMLAVPLGLLFQRAWLPWSTEMQSSWQLLLRFLVIYETLGWGLYDALVPTMTEAYVQRYGSLLRYYAGQGVRYGLWVSLLLLAVLGGVTDRFIEGVLGGVEGPWETLLAPLLIWGALQWLPWSAERSLVALGRPALRSWLLVGETVLRLVGLSLLPSRRDPGMVAMVYLGALLLRGFLGWGLLRRLNLHARVPFWQAVVAPGGAAFILYNLLRLAGDLLWRPAAPSTLLFCLGALFLAIPLYGFLTGLLGGWDAGGVVELRRALHLSGLGMPVGWLLYQGVRGGAAISPLHNQFPIRQRELVEEEAEALMFRRPRS